MFATEVIFRGKTLGKLITATLVACAEGNLPTFSQFLKRNLIRAVPFNALSALGRPCVPWHDSLSDTYVIDKKVLDLKKRKEQFFSELASQSSKKENIGLEG